MIKVLATTNCRDYAVIDTASLDEALSLARLLARKARNSEGVVLVGEEVIFRWERPQSHSVAAQRRTTTQPQTA
jgi:hypothetical protein